MRHAHSRALPFFIFLISDFVLLYLCSFHIHAATLGIFAAGGGERTQIETGVSHVESEDSEIRTRTDQLEAFLQEGKAASGATTHLQSAASLEAQRSC